MKKILWREKGTKCWNEGWIITQDGRKVQIAQYNGAPEGCWYDWHDIEIDGRDNL